MTATDTIKTLLLQASIGQNPDNKSVKELMSEMKLALTARSVEKARAQTASYMRGYNQRKREEQEGMPQMQLAALQEAATPKAD
jgi:hypothetical protein